MYENYLTNSNSLKIIGILKSIWNFICSNWFALMVILTAILVILCIPIIITVIVTIKNRSDVLSSQGEAENEVYNSGSKKIHEDSVQQLDSSTVQTELESNPDSFFM